MLDDSSFFLHIKTPLAYSNEISLLTSQEGFKRDVYLKLDNCQPSGSFKIRGLGYMILKNIKEKQMKHIISSSGGNAGLACALAAHKLNIKATIVVPTTTLLSVIEKLKSLGAEVIVHGDIWDQADSRAHELNDTIDGSFYVPPFDHPLIWRGHSYLIDEIKEQMGDKLPDCIIASVGGGGLVLGLIEGMIRNGWFDKGVKVIAVETEGADCFNKSIKSNQIVTLDAITSIAKSLGARRCAEKLFEYYQLYKEHIESVVVSDRDVVQVMSQFLDDHRILVEPSCGASLVVGYNIQNYYPNQFKNVVIECCGGSSITLTTLLNYKKDFNV